jgi:hypothetical protein
MHLEYHDEIVDQFKFRRYMFAQQMQQQKRTPQERERIAFSDKMQRAYERYVSIVVGRSFGKDWFSR